MELIYWGLILILIIIALIGVYFFFKGNTGNASNEEPKAKETTAKKWAFK